MKKNILLLVLLSFLITIIACGADMKITKEKAITIANKEAIKLGYGIKNMDVWITKYDTPWNDYLPKDSNSQYVIERINKLKGKEYWAVSYTPKKETGIVFGGNLCLFIDYENGKIIATIMGK